MKSQILNAAILLAVGASLTACGDSNKGKSGNQSILNAKSQPEKEFTGEPATPEEMANQTYRLKTEQQEFVLKKVAQLVWSHIECKADNSKVILTFYPEFIVRMEAGKKENLIVSPGHVCGNSLPSEKNPVIPTGFITKDENNQYSVQYGMPEAETPIFSMNWDENNATPGEISCMAEDGQVFKTALSKCTIVSVPTIEPAP